VTVGDQVVRALKGLDGRRGRVSERAVDDDSPAALVEQPLGIPETTAERIASGDPRPSLEERYATLANYTALATAAANTLVAQLLLLPSDAAAAIQSATKQAQKAGLN